MVNTTDSVSSRKATAALPDLRAQSISRVAPARSVVTKLTSLPTTANAATIRTVSRSSRVGRHTGQHRFQQSA